MADRRFAFDRLLGRFRLLLVLTLLIFGAVLIRLIDLQVVRGRSFREKATNNRIRKEILRAHRGQLLDRHGRVLADNAPSFQLLFDPRDRLFRESLGRFDSVLVELAGILDRDVEDLRATVVQARRRGLPPVTLARDLGFPTLSVLEERMEHFVGVEVRPVPARRYPHGSLAAHLIGYVAEVSEEEVGRRERARPYRMQDLIGRAGIEREQEEFLRGGDGLEYVGVDALGRRTNLFGELPSRPSVRGHDVVLTLDLDLQRTAEEALDSVPALLAAAGIDTTEPKGGCVVALDPRNGAVLALASRPTFDPNLFVRGLSEGEWRQLSSRGYPLLNRVVQSAYPPGSTFKVVTALAGLHEGLLDPDLPMPQPCRGGLVFGDRTFRCWKREGHGALTLHEAIVRSCDVYFYQVGIRLGVERLMDYAEACSLGVLTRIDLPQERSSLVPTLDWYLRERGRRPFPGAALNLSIGQGDLLLSPISLARFVAALVNGGRILRPHVVEAVLDRDGQPLFEAGERSWLEADLPATSEELRLIREALEGVVMEPRGTGKRARVEGFRVAGKTGTAENPHGEDHALFFGYAPVEEPEIVVVVILEQSGHGGSAAAPTAQRVLSAYLSGGTRPLASRGQR